MPVAKIRRRDGSVAFIERAQGACLSCRPRRIGAGRMRKGVKLVGMGNGVLYATREDADGLIWLQRYALP